VQALRQSLAVKERYSPPEGATTYVRNTARSELRRGELGWRIEQVPLGKEMTDVADTWQADNG
jgi:hypothetical protein